MAHLPRLLLRTTGAPSNGQIEGLRGAAAALRSYSEGNGGQWGGNTFVSRLWRNIRGGEQVKAADGSGDASNTHAEEAASSSSGLLIPASSEARFREVLALALPRRPLFPNTIMTVHTKDDKLLAEVTDLQKAGAQAYLGVFVHRGSKDDQATGAPEFGKAEAIKLASAEDVDEQLAEVGTFAQVHAVVPSARGVGLVLLGHRRLRRTAAVSTSPLRLAVQHLRDLPYDQQDNLVKATNMEMLVTLKELLHLHPLYNEQLKVFADFGIDFHDSSRLADVGATLTSASKEELLVILEQLSVPDRCNEVLMLLKKEVELCKIQLDIGKRVEEKINKDQRKYFLMEQLKSIKKELGLERDDKSTLVQKFRDRLDEYEGGVPEHAMKVIEEELQKLSTLEPSSSEFNVTRNYLEWLTSIPWGKYSEEKLDIHHAQQVLDADHYGLEDVKERILEFIAVGKLRGSTQGKIVCLVGPPGVGKTSIGKSIAGALGRKYYRFSVGGLSDVAEIKGHRRTYVGAMPGKMVQCLKTAGTSNPLVLIDEIDKLGSGYQGDPASALLELLDPEQNVSFMDHYLDVPVDLSTVLFMCTANVLDRIPGPLLDRMEVIRLSGYIFNEKVQIARRYLEPQCRKEAGVPEGSTLLTDEALNVLIDQYCREAGVRNLKKHLEKLYRKVALELVREGVEVQRAAEEVGPLDRLKTDPSEVPSGVSEVSKETAEKVEKQLHSGESESESSSGSESPRSEVESIASVAESTDDKQEAPVFASPVFAEPKVVIKPEDLKKYVGQPPFSNDKIYETTPSGVVMGLAWTAMGGSTLYVEAAGIKTESKSPRMKVTGQLGDVMKESADIASTYTLKFLKEKQPDNKFFEDHMVHIHVPAGAVPKDGPSAGCTIITALLSLAMDKPVRRDLAMTGEVTLTGRVLPIGGVKEKTLAARRAGVTCIIFPEGNKRDYEELSDDVREGLEPHFVEQYEQVYKLAFEEP